VALTSGFGGAEGIRTPDLLIANETRYQLRHSPKLTSYDASRKDITQIWTAPNPVNLTDRTCT